MAPRLALENEPSLSRCGAAKVLCYCREFLNNFINWGISAPSGHSDSGLYKNSGPSTIVFHFLVRFPFIPREGRSPGFCTPGQCLRKSCVVYSREFSLFLLSHIASMSRSLSNTRFSHHLHSSGSCKALLTVLESLTRMLAPSNSSRLGTLCFLSGATLVFAETKLTSTWPLQYWDRRYMAAA